MPQVTTDSRARIWSLPASTLSFTIAFDFVYSNNPTCLSARILVIDNEYKLFNSISKFSSISINVIWCDNVQADPKSINQTKQQEELHWNWEPLQNRYLTKGFYPKYILNEKNQISEHCMLHGIIFVYLYFWGIYEKMFKKLF